MTSFLIRLSVGLLLSTVAFQQSVLPAEAVEYYVTPVLPNPKCPADQPCLELDQFALNSSLYFSDRDSVTLHFLDGDHILMQELNFTGIEKLLWLGNSHIQIRCGTAITFNNVSELVMSKLSIISQSDNCSDFSWSTSSFYLEEVMITSIHISVISEGIIFITNSTFNRSPLLLASNGQGGDREIVIKNSRLIDSPEEYSLGYYENCDDCRINLTLYNLITNRSKLNSSRSVLYSEVGDLFLFMTLYAPHKVNITNSSFNRSPGIGVMQLVLQHHNNK